MVGTPPRNFEVDGPAASALAAQLAAAERSVVRLLPLGGAGGIGLSLSLSRAALDTDVSFAMHGLTFCVDAEVAELFEGVRLVLAGPQAFRFESIGASE